ncbi:MAG: site-2 protease family protein, partial [Euryarchaeota archaeon]|nr:site-2 protease family protein [Euryarchaeota archaeon]
LFGVSKETDLVNINIDNLDEFNKATSETKDKKPTKVASREQRARILAAGVMSNFAVAFVAFLLFFGPVLGAIAPLSDAMVINVTNGSSAYDVGIRDGMVITGIDDTSIQNANDIILYMKDIEAGSIVQIHASTDRVVSVYDVEVGEDTNDDLEGVYVNAVVTDSPAEDAGLESGMLILQIDDTAMRSSKDFIFFMNATQPDQTIHITVLQQAEMSSVTNNTTVLDVDLAQHPDATAEKGFLGIYYGTEGLKSVPLGISVGEYPARDYLEMLKKIPSMLTGIGGWLILFGLPIVGFAGEGFPGFSGNLAQFYHAVGWGEPLGIGVFWIANALLWIGWLNFYVGLFNCLPAVPLDGGHVFKDYLQSFCKRILSSETRADKLANSIAGMLTILILMSFVFMIFGPYIVHGF